MRVEEVCSRRIVHVEATTTLQHVARLMRDQHQRALFVTEHGVTGTRVVGIVTDRDMVVHGLAGHTDCGTAPVSEVMTRGVLTIDADAVISDALRIMLGHGLHRLAVIDGQKMLIGMLTLDDTIRAIGGEWTLLAGILGREQSVDHGAITAQPRLLV
ncbi:CBS domain-containing protein [Ralstonia solanacearum]|uniref:CBS domain-containing protein n=1 Tax=Ralstonia solanacearum TaxID=305 RepID=UPI00078CD9D8|nr:CBS domain-containing protein [Ralstonia solanacearum]AMP37333.1 histidine kinase [Ralstonia solanacearum]AXV86154.1 CBS domain-containing protein [Ralstonia solanacearum]AXW05662.1 CBS domain-containing protein [Ralstonia solanacearum]AXW23403.1 CBS domain-containing protein [Ralstonia solanacearum]AXW80335.1 CBS domain-containing protein [Ralstonia solanacearum]